MKRSYEKAFILGHLKQLSGWVLYICITMFVATPSQSNERPISLDSHLHFEFGRSGDPSRVIEKLEAYFQYSKAQKALAISPAYLVNEKFELFRGMRHLRDVFNQSTATVVSRFPDRLVGLCGLGHLWQDGSEVLSRCLSYEGMKGIKLRVVDNDDIERLTIPYIFNNLIRALDQNRDKVKVVLIHMPGAYPYNYFRQYYDPNKLKQEYNDDVADIAKLIELGEMFPDIQFVVAHSMYSHVLVKELALMAKARRLRNFWIEVSQSLTHINPEHWRSGYHKKSWRNFVSAWRELGIDRILFGSDQVLGDNGILEIEDDQGKAFQDQLNSIVNNPYLTVKEKEGILRTNGQSLVEYLQGKSK